MRQTSSARSTPTLTGEINARRNPSVSGESSIKEEDPSPAQLESMAAEVFEELGNMDQTPIQHEMSVETALEKRGAKDAPISTGGESVTVLRFFSMTRCADLMLCCFL